MGLAHPGAMEFINNGALGYAHLLLPDLLCAVDKTMEETFMTFAKGSGRLIGIFEHYGAYQIKKSEAAVLKVVSAIQSFTNRWRVFDKNRLYSLSSGLAVGIDVENDVLGTEDHWRSLKEE